MFPLAVVGIDGYLATTPLVSVTGGTGFYLVGEWFFGALVLITLLWPLLRVAFLRLPRVALVVLGLLELALFFSANTAFGYILSCVPIEGLFSFALGVYFGHSRDRIYGNCRAALLGGGMAIIGLLMHPMLPRGIDYVCFQLVACGVLLLVDGFPKMRKATHLPNSLRVRWAGPLVSLSGLTMYFFMFQHVVAVDFIGSSVSVAASGFSSFNYWGLAILALVATFFASLLASATEKKLRSVWGKTD